MTAPLSPTEIADRLAILDVLHLYAHMVDTRDWGVLDDVFAADAQADYTSSGGQQGAVKPVMEWLDRALEPWPINLHCITNVRIEFAYVGNGASEGDAATSSAYFHAPMGRGDLGQQVVVTNSGSYEDRWVRTPAGWRITERTCRQTLMEGSLPDGYVIPD